VAYVVIGFAAPNMSERETVDIAGLDKVDLLHRLWENGAPASWYTSQGFIPPVFNEFKAATAVDDYIDYFEGRCIKTDLSRPIAYPGLYDRDYGQGAFARIVAEMKDEIKRNSAVEPIE
jgi:hypothetical protein